MRTSLWLPVAFFACTSLVEGRGLLIPVEPDLPPLAMLNHEVDVTLEDQVAVTRVTQTFRNHTDRGLEATYVFPVPSGASVREFAMWIDGKRVKGELHKAEKAREMYTSIVRQTKNPALLEYIGDDLLTLKVFPVPARGDQKVEVRLTALARKELALVEYVYPLETDRVAAETLEEFRLKVAITSQQPIGSIYSPTHDIAIRQPNDHEATVTYERKGQALDRDFRLFYSSSGEEIGLTALQQRPLSDEPGYVMLLLSPRAELAQKKKVPRDIVFVVDTSGSMMEEKKMDQARRAVRHCLEGLTPDDRFGLIQFASTVERYRDALAPANEEHLARAHGWVSGLYAGGGTAVAGALELALEMRTDETGRMFTVVLITDGQPTIGEMNTEKILADVAARNSDNTRMFCFGLGHDLNAVLLDQLAQQSRGVSRYVRPDEDLEAKVAGFFDKIRNPVLANLQVSTDGDVRLSEVYPPELPDLFHGDQLVVLARYDGSGPASVVLEGTVGGQASRFEYDLEFAPRSDARPFVEELWARRKVGYLLDNIRINGEQGELVDEVVRLATSYGITTPYTSYLIMPDTPLELAAADGQYASGRLARRGGPAALGLDPGKDGANKMARLEDFARKAQREGGFASRRDALQNEALSELEADEKARPAGSSQPASPAREAVADRLREAKRLKTTLDRAQQNYRQGHLRANQVEQLGVDLAVSTGALKTQRQLQASAIRRVAHRNCMEIGGVWIDEAFQAETPTLSIRAQSDAYFRVLAAQPQMKAVFGLGNHVLWIAPNGTALVVDTGGGREEISDREIAELFAAK